jgi:hypothetical protein
MGDDNGSRPLVDGRLHRAGRGCKRFGLDVDRRDHEPVPLEDPRHVRVGDRRDDYFGPGLELQGVEQELKPGPDRRARDLPFGVALRPIWAQAVGKPPDEVPDSQVEPVSRIDPPAHAAKHSTAPVRLPGGWL